MKKLLISITYILLITGKLTVYADETKREDYSNDYVDLYSDEMIYDNKAEKITALGNVRVFFDDLELYGDKVEYFKNKNSIIASGNINFKKGEYSLTSEKLEYNIEFSSGIVSDASIKSDPYYIYADKVIIKSKDEFFIPKGDVTTCDHQPPHYKFSGKKIKLQMHKKLSAYSMLMYIRGLPAFYYPYYSKKLGPRKMETDLDFGSSSRDGDFLKTKISYPLTENSRSYAGVDLMSKRGVGFKAGHSYRTSRGYSDVDLYFIREKDTGLDKGRLYAKGWQEITKHLAVRYRTEYTSDYTFNYNYDQGQNEYRKQDLYYQLGFEYTRARYMLSVSADRKEEWSEDSYELSRYVMPTVRLDLYPTYLPGRLRFRGNAQYKNEYLSGSEEWQPEISWAGKIDKTYRFNIGRIYSLSLSPGVGYEGVYRDSFKRYTSMFLGVNNGWFRKLFINGDYLQRKSVEDKDIVYNKINYRVSYIPSSRFSLSTESSYDFMDGVEKPVGNFFTRAKFYNNGTSLYVRNRYDYYASRPREWLYELNVKNHSITRVKYNYINPDRLELDQRFRMRLFPFLLSFGARFNLEQQDKFYKFSNFIERSASVTWNMHCWDSMFKFSKRGDETEFWIMFNVSAFPSPKAGLYKNSKYDDIRYIRQ
jgi:lipopolysaccharide export system protein LptA